MQNKRLYYIIGLLLVFIAILFEARGKGDFYIFISASRDLFVGKNIYKELYSNYYHYFYSPLFAIILYPLTFLPIYLVKVLWLILNVFFTYRIWKLICRYLDFSVFSGSKKLWLFTLIAFAFISFTLKANFHLSQVTILILFLILEGIYRINNNQILLGALLIAIGIDIKILPIVILPYLLYRGYFKASAMLVLALVLLIFLPVVFLGWEHTTFLLHERWNLINPLNANHILDAEERSFHSLTTLLSVFLVENQGDAYALAIKRNIADVSLHSLQIIITCVRLFFIILTLFYLRSRPFVKSKSKLQQLYELSYILLLVPLIFPHQQHYAFFFMFPATTYIVYYYMMFFYAQKTGQSSLPQVKRKKIGIWVLMSFLFLILNAHLLLGSFIKYYDHYKTLTFGALLLVAVLFVCRPEKIENNQRGEAVA